MLTLFKIIDNFTFFENTCKYLYVLFDDNRS
jgi:hypothetical protein